MKKILFFFLLLLGCDDKDDGAQYRIIGTIQMYYGEYDKNGKLTAKFNEKIYKKCPIYSPIPCQVLIFRRGRPLPTAFPLNDEDIQYLMEYTSADPYRTRVKSKIYFGGINCFYSATGDKYFHDDRDRKSVV